MKKAIYISIALVVIIAGSCRKFLTKTPQGTLSPSNYYNNESEINTALAGVYDVVGQEITWGCRIPVRHNASTDESWFSYTSFPTGPFWYNYDPSDATVGELWKVMYQGIERANGLLANINKPDMDSSKRSVAKGEALFLRAFCYFTLVQYWGDVPLKLVPSSSVNNVDIARTPVKEVYAQILADMKEAESRVLTIQQTGISGRITKSAVRGILARVCLTMAGEPLKDASRFQEARDWAKKVKDDSYHSLNPDYTKVFINECADIEDPKECIWEAEEYGTNNDAFREGGRMGNENGVKCSATNTDSVGYAYGFISATRKLYYLYSAADKRRDWSIGGYTLNAAGVKTNLAATTIYPRNCAKWRREYEVVFPKNKNYTPTNFPILRYSDVLLMLAEAENEVNGPTALAHESLNLVRKRAGLSDTTIAGADGFRAEVRNERARELCFEGLRKPDLIRWGIFVPTMKEVAAEFKAYASSTYQYATTAAGNVTERHLLYPIPIAEMSLNKAITQNPGW